MNEIRSGIDRRTVIKKREIGLVDIIVFVRMHFLTLVVCVLLGLFGGIAVYNYVPHKWQADVILKIGKIPVMQSFSYIREPAEVMEKVKSPMFLSELLLSIYGRDIEPDSPTGKLFYKSLKASVVKGSNFVKISVFGWTAEEAYKNAGVLADKIVAEHNLIVENFLAKTRKQLSDVNAGIAQNNEILNKVNGLERSASPGAKEDALIRMAIINNKTAEIQKLREEQARLENLIFNSQLQATTVISRSTLLQMPSSPNLLIVIIGGVLSGLLLGVLLSFGLSIRGRIAASTAKL